MNLLPKVAALTEPNNNKGEDIMDISSLKMVKDNLSEVKDTNKKEKKSTEKKHGCIKMNDYFSF
jgi:L-asparaginase/Glu-tRNA(Gln) amidotransferase subunit D